METEKDFNLRVGLRIREIREMQHLTREQCSEICDISASFLSSVENGKKAVTSKTLYKICTGLNVSADFLLFGTHQGFESDMIIEMIRSIDNDFRPFAIQILKNYVEAVHSVKK